MERVQVHVILRIVPCLRSVFPTVVPALLEVVAHRGPKSFVRIHSSGLCCSWCVTAQTWHRPSPCTLLEPLRQWQHLPGSSGTMSTHTHIDVNFPADLLSEEMSLEQWQTYVTGNLLILMSIYLYEHLLVTHSTRPTYLCSSLHLTAWGNIGLWVIFNYLSVPSYS